MDIDNRRGFGPEHYYSNCNQLQVGEYIFAVNYFNEALFGLTRTATTTLTLTVPGSTRTFTPTLPEDLQSAGDNAPIKVAKIAVERIVDPNNANLNDKLKYQIIDI